MIVRTRSVSLLRDEVVAEHPLHRDRAEEVRVHAERREVHVGKAEPLGEGDRLGLLLGARGELDFSVQLLGHAYAVLPFTT